MFSRCENSGRLPVLVAAVLVLSALPAPAAGWQVVTTGDSSRQYHDVVFLDENRGFIVGEASGQGLFMYTTNGGHSLDDWQEATYAAPLRRIFFLPADDNYGWIIGDGKIVLHTVDGGQTWNPFDTTGISDNSLRGVFFADAGTGWIASTSAFSGSIFKKQDSASNWVQESISSGGYFSDIAFPNPAAGWAVASGNCSIGCFYTSSGDGIWNPVTVSTRAFYSLRIVGPNELWAAGDWNAGQGSALMVWNGANWNPQVHPLADLRDIDFAGSDSSNGWAVGLGGTIIRRQAGGWSREPSPVTTDLEGIAVIDGERAFAVGADGTIIFRGCTLASECSDGNECTDDVCTAGVCTNPPQEGNPCTDDGNVCTDDFCDPADGQCHHRDNTASCDDGDPCTWGDTCWGGSCAGTLRDCSDGNVCTDDFCDPADGQCHHRDNTASCDDGDPCTWGDTCSGGSCAGTPRDCNDDNVCTDDVCDEVGVCQHFPNAAPCDDGLWCTVGDTCRDGSCQGSERDCGALSGPCYFYSCDEEAKACVSGQAKPAGTQCEPCGQCDGLGNCRPSPARQGDACDDGEECTGTGLCDQQGTCVIEGWCEEIVAAGCVHPAAVYGPGQPDCRLPPDKVEVVAEIGPSESVAEELFPVRVRVRNTASDSHNATSWVKDLSELSLQVHLEAGRDSKGPVYLVGSALLNGSAEGISESWNAGNATLLLTFDTARVGTLAPLTAEGGPEWLVDFYLAGASGQGELQVRVLAPCRARAEEVGCHDAGGWQAISGLLTAPVRPGRYLVAGGQDATSGCGCTTSSRAGLLVVLAFPLLLLARRRRTR